MSAVDFRLPVLLTGAGFAAVGTLLVSGHRFAYFPTRPEATLRLTGLEERYKEGLVVHGVQWRKGLRAYSIWLANSDSQSEMSGVRIAVAFDGPVLAKQVEGGSVDGIRLTSFVPPLNHANQQGEIERIERMLPNNVWIESIKLPPQAHIAVSVVVEPKADLSDKAFVDLKYGYTGWNEQRKIYRVIHPLAYQSGALRIEESRTLSRDFSRRFAFYGEGVTIGFDFIEAQQSKQ